MRELHISTLNTYERFFITQLLLLFPLNDDGYSGFYSNFE